MCDGTEETNEIPPSRQSMLRPMYELGYLVNTKLKFCACLRSEFIYRSFNDALGCSDYTSSNGNNYLERMWQEVVMNSGTILATAWRGRENPRKTWGESTSQTRALESFLRHKTPELTYRHYWRWRIKTQESATNSSDMTFMPCFMIVCQLFQRYYGEHINGHIHDMILPFRTKYTKKARTSMSFNCIQSHDHNSNLQYTTYGLYCLYQLQVMASLYTVRNKPTSSLLRYA
jgi:hypothetical protein